MTDINCVVRESAIVGECPTWCEQTNRLYWVDIQGKKIHCYHPDSQQNNTFQLSEIVTAIALCEDRSKLIIALRKKIAVFDLTTQYVEILMMLEDDLTHNRFNDAKCDPAGRFWPGSMNDVNWSSPDGILYRINSVKHYDVVQKDVTCSNGMGWSPDYRTMYFTDSFRYTIFAFDYDNATGFISHRRPFVVLDKANGAFPDGLTVDAEGFVWSAHVGVGQIVRYDPSGKQERVIQLPVSRATSCTFGGNNLKMLYITSATETLTTQQLSNQPLAGSLFSIETNIQGLPTNRIPKIFYMDSSFKLI